jgi:cytochrome b
MNATQEPCPLPMWDAFVRVFHWSNALLVCITYFLLEGGETPHEWAGYVIGLLLAARIFWGFAGSANARFAAFFPTPSRLRRHFTGFPASLYGPALQRAGHNPLGAVMIFALLMLLTLCSITGWMQITDRWWGEEWVQELHGTSAHALMICAGVHVLAVLVLQRISGVPLVRRMVTGQGTGQRAGRTPFSE